MMRRGLFNKVIGLFGYALFLPSSLLFFVFFFSSCGGGLKDVREEEAKKVLELSPEEKLSLAGEYLKNGLFSDAKVLFSDVESKVSVADCKVGKSGFMECPYCSALYGKYISDFFGTLKLVADLLGIVSGESEAGGSGGEVVGQSPIFTSGNLEFKAESENITDFDRQIGQSLGKGTEFFIGLLLRKINQLRGDLGKIILLNCSMQSSVTVPIKIANLEIVFPGENEKGKDILYSPIFARLNWAILSLFGGVLDMAYSQNYSLSLTATLQFLKDVLKAESLQQTLLLLGDFFANNPSFLSLIEERKDFWKRAATDFADSLTGINDFFERFCNYNGTEVSNILLDNLLSTILKSAGLNLSILGDIDAKNLLCNPIIGTNPLSYIVKKLLSKWADAISGKNTCKVEEVGGVKRISKSYDFNSDGCIRFADDITRVLESGLRDTLQRLIKLLSVEIAIHPGNFFGNPRGIRELLPLVRKTESGKFVFGIEIEKGGDSEHFKGTFYTLSGGYPVELTEDISIQKDCVPPPPNGTLLYIPFADPTLGGSLFLSTYKISLVDSCFTSERDMGIADENYLVMPDIRAGNYALNKIISASLGNVISSLLRGM